ncbi:helix-turn-helix domain-containing protein [Microlunatus flavus]|uniref:Homeodomain-like domain-containing protein n=1 Tax=Microlunatus flavus TaxID=1036181 RepID=A0A1H9FD10_9ACTN|nr:helix-turn-helix domain-containing protein [Microlunatus flavus]SEQ35792.1 Homeodomain-like domain-containing protein [Microlunatus flavus]
MVVDTTTPAEALDVASGATSSDPALGLRSVAALRRLADRLEDLQVARARERGWSWAEIAAALGVSKQAVHKKHAGPRR